nr:guanine nucleotide binding protein G(k) subunit [Hymenolepis microstoma]
MTSLLVALRNFGTSGLDFEKSETMEVVQFLFQNSSNSNSINSPFIIEAIKQLRDDGQFCNFVKNNWSQSGFTTDYFFSFLERLTQNDYLPTRDDILNINCGQLGLHEEIITRDKLSFRFIMPVMSRSRLSKLSYYFDGVDAIIFVASLSDYDVNADVSNEKPKLRDDMDFFASICNSKWFAKCSSIFLILNKFDIFQKKLPTSPLKTCFPDYRGMSC